MLRHSFFFFLLTAFFAPSICAQEPSDAGDASVPIVGEVLDGVIGASDAVWNRELFTLDEHVFHVSQVVRAAIVFALVLLVAYGARAVLRRTVLRRLAKSADQTRTDIDNTILAVVGATSAVSIVAVALYFGLSSLPLSDRLRDWLTSGLVIAGVYQAARWANVAVQRAIERVKQRRVAGDPSSATAFGLMAFFGRIAVWTAALLIVLDNLGFEITALIAGLGVGGIAVAFALQNILGDVFCSIAILLDKPFVVGDFIIVGDLMGTVERIGIKTTRIRSLGGEQIVFSNADLIGSRIRNYKRMFERRVQFGFGVVYETPGEKLEAIPGVVRGIIETQGRTRFDRAHFKEFGDFSLNFEVVYYVLVPEYNEYMDIQQRINLAIFREFESRGIAFAYPTQELIVRRNGAKAAAVGAEASKAGRS